MEWTEQGDSSGREIIPVRENGFLQGSQSSSNTSLPLVSIDSAEKKVESKDNLFLANILRSRNKFADALVLYEKVLEKDNENLEAHIGKGICLQMQNKIKPAFESFAEAIRLDPQNVRAFTHRGILYKEEGRLMEAVEVCYETSPVR